MAIVCACLPTLPHLFRHWYDGKQPSQSMRSTGSLIGRKMVAWMKTSKSDSSAAFSELERGWASESSTSGLRPESGKDDSSPMGRFDRYQLSDLRSVRVHEDAGVYGSTKARS